MSFQQEMDQAIKEKRLYFIGQSLPPDWYAAVIQWTPLAEAGDPKAQYNLGRCFSRGDGTDRDDEKSRYWLEKAAAQNDPRAMFNLSILFAEKSYLNRDEDLSEQYLAKAAALNEPRALSTYEKRKVQELELENKKKAQELQKINSQKLEAVQLFVRKIQEALNDKNLQKAKDLVLKEIKENPDFTDGEVILAILNLHISNSVKTRSTSHTTSTGVFQGTTQYVSFKMHYKTAQVAVKNTSNIELTGLCFSLRGSKRGDNVDPYAKSYNNDTTLKPQQTTTINSREGSVDNPEYEPLEIDSLSIGFTLRPPLSNSVEHLYIKFDKPIILKKDPGVLGYFIIVIFIIIIISMIVF